MTAVKAGFEDGAVVVVVVVSTVAAVVDEGVVAVASPVVVFAAVKDVAVAVPSAGLSDDAAAALFLSPKKLGRRLIISCQKKISKGFCSKLHRVVIVNHYFIACFFIGL